MIICMNSNFFQIRRYEDPFLIRYIPNQWTMCFARSDWLLKLRIVSTSLHFSGFRGRVSLISQGKKELFGAGYPLPGFVYTKTNIHLSDIYVATSQLGIYPPLFTFTSVNKCLFKHDNVDEQEMLAKSLCPKKNAVIFLTENCNR